MQYLEIGSSQMGRNISSYNQQKLIFSMRNLYVQDYVGPGDLLDEGP